MKILILSLEAWREDENGGNVLSNIFKDIDADFAQVYCCDAEPSNNICKLYYQMTDRMMLDSIINRKTVGLVKSYNTFPKYTKPHIQYGYKVGNFLGKFKYIAREILWKLGNWNNYKFKTFIQSFNPDVIFAPCYNYMYMMRITELVKQIANVPIISYISDDFYTNKQYNFNPLFWIKHFFIRKHVRQLFKIYDLVYTMTDEQKLQCEKDFHANMKILRKSGSFNVLKEKKNVNNPIKFVYAGGLYLSRWKTLAALADAMRIINKSSTQVSLDIYTRSNITAKMDKRLNDGETAIIHDAISIDELKSVYADSDVALHVESFEKKYMYDVRLSFSTKIVDCLDSGCAVIAICDERQAGLSYLKRNDAAICITDINQILPTLTKIVTNKNMLIEYQHKAFELGRINHLEKNTKFMLQQDFKNIVSHV